jgi:GNAT superfamily N-acetyltransferase
LKRHNFTELEENELTFLREHRSAVFDCEFGTAFLSSDPEPATWNFVGALRSSSIAVPEAIERTVALFGDWQRTPCLKVTPMSEPAGWEEALGRANWRVAITLTHMVATEPPPDVAGVEVRDCSNEGDVDVFSTVQSEGFGSPVWKAWVHKVNLINYRREHQSFYVAIVAGKPTGVCLAVRTGTVAGLYAVATLAADRSKGVARALVRRAMVDARDRGCEVVCLNTLSGGPAETAFSRLGFRNVFESKFFVR